MKRPRSKFKKAWTALNRDTRLVANEEWLPLEVQANQRVGLASGWLTIGCLVVILVSFVAWAVLSTIPEITRGDGKVVSKTQKQVIQSLEGGLLGKLLVSEGEIVDSGEAVVSIDPTKAEALFDEVNQKIAALQAAKSRLHAESYGARPEFPPELIAEYPHIVKTEVDAYASRKKGLDDAVGSLRRSRTLVERELKMLRPMVDKGAVSLVEVLRLERQANELALQAEERQNKFRSEANNELTKIASELAQHEAQGKAKKDLVERTVLRSPVRGVVTRIYTHTIGGVINPGAPILDISPLDDQLIIETKIRPSDVAFLRPGLPATVKVTAYDYSKFGGLKATVVHVSPDTFEDPGARNPAQTEPYYQVLVQTERNSLSDGDVSHAIIPGMVASVEIQTGEKSILEFIMKPMSRLSGAFTER